MGGRVQAEDRQLAAGRRRDRRDHPHRRGLAGAVGAEEPEGLPRPHVEVDARGPPRRRRRTCAARAPRSSSRRGGRRRRRRLVRGSSGGPERGVEGTRPTLRSPTDRVTRLSGSTATGRRMGRMTRDPRAAVPSSWSPVSVAPSASVRRSRCGWPRTAGTWRRRTGRRTTTGCPGAATTRTRRRWPPALAERGRPHRGGRRPT